MTFYTSRQINHLSIYVLGSQQFIVKIKADINNPSLHSFDRVFINIMRRRMKIYQSLLELKNIFINSKVPLWNLVKTKQTIVRKLKQKTFEVYMGCSKVEIGGSKVEIKCRCSS